MTRFIAVLFAVVGLANTVVGALGFDGLDINMGCPDKSVAARA